MKSNAVAPSTLGLILFFAFQSSVFLSSTPAYATSAPTDASSQTMTGINLNSNIEKMIDADSANAGVVWHRGFFCMFDYLSLLNTRKFRTSPTSNDKITQERVEAFKRIQANSKIRTIVTLKWNFFDLERGLRLRIPQPDSNEEKSYFAAARSLIDELGSKANIIVVGNEPANETLVEDMSNVPQADGTNPNPTVRFYRRLAWNLNNHMIANKIRNEKLILLGSLTNVLDMRETYKRDLIERFLYVAQKESYIDGIDIHIHVPDMNIYEESLKKVRTLYNFSKKITVTEYSLITAFRSHLTQPLCEGPAALRFCQSYNLPLNMRELDYLNSAVCRGPRPIKDCQTVTQKYKLPVRIEAAEWADFFRTRAYLPTNFLAAADKLHNEYSVYVATYSGYSFLGQLLIAPENATPSNNLLPVPWAYNGLFSKNILGPLASGLTRANDYFMVDFLSLFKGPSL